jgi:hypothetical protein
MHRGVPGNLPNNVQSLSAGVVRHGLFLCPPMGNEIAELLYNTHSSVTRMSWSSECRDDSDGAMPASEREIS